MGIGFVGTLGLVVPTLSIACTMIWDTSYTFWLGWSYPLRLLSLSLGTLALFAVACVLFHLRAVRTGMDERAFAWTATAFSAFCGVCLVILAIPGSRSLHVAA